MRMCSCKEPSSAAAADVPNSLGHTSHAVLVMPALYPGCVQAYLFGWANIMELAQHQDSVMILGNPSAHQHVP